MFLPVDGVLILFGKCDGTMIKFDGVYIVIYSTGIYCVDIDSMNSISGLIMRREGGRFFTTTWRDIVFAVYGTATALAGPVCQLTCYTHKRLSEHLVVNLPNELKLCDYVWIFTHHKPREIRPTSREIRPTSREIRLSDKTVCWSRPTL